VYNNSVRVEDKLYLYNLKNIKTRMSYDNPWLYQGKIFETEDIGENFGFIYLIECEENNKLFKLFSL